MRKLQLLTIPLFLWLCSCQSSTPKVEQTAIRIVPLSASMGEMLDLLCPDSLLVARTAYGNYSAAVEALPVIATYPKLDVEAVLKLKPTHVFSNGGMTSADQLKKLEDYGIQVFAPSFQSVEEIFETFAVMGKTLACEQRGQFIQDSLLNELKSIKPHANWTALGVISADPMYVYGQNTIFTDIVKKLGGQNAMQEADYPVIDKELLVRLNPDKIVTTHKKELLSHFQDRVVSKALKALQNEENCIEVNSDWLSRPSHHILKAIKQIEEQL